MFCLMIRFLFIQILVLLAGISASFAQGLANGAAQGHPAAGTVVVAAMEAVGYHAQNQILTSLNQMMGDLGSLIYLGVIVSAILTVGLMGRYQAALWLLIGPAIFVYVSGVELGGQKNRINTSGPDWKMGAFEGPQELKERLMGRADSPTDVSFVFHKYNELISEIYQLLINKITSEDAKKPVLFMARQRLVEDMFSIDLVAPGSQQLGAFFFGHCSNYITYARALGKGRRDKNYRQTSVYLNAKKEYCDGFDVQNINLSNESIVLSDYLSTMTPPYETGDKVSCLQLWNWFRQTAARDYASQAEAILNTVFGPEVMLVEGGGVVGRALSDVLGKITGDGSDTNDVEGTDPCPFPYDAASDVLVAGGDVAASLRTFANLFSALMIRKNNTADSNATGFMSIMGGDMAGVYPSSDAGGHRQVVSLAGRESILRAQNSRTFAVARQFEAFSMLMLIPYFQGMILYVLAVSYPFFALTILVPGQAGSFFNWLALWAWAKSWDVGFAMVMVIDQLLWEILPKTTFFDAGVIGENTPVELLEMHYSGDYAYSVSMYWLIVSALIGAIPIVTAEAILGSKKAVAGALVGGISDISTRVNKAIEDYYATRNVVDIVRARTQKEVSQLMANAATAGAGLDKMNKEMPQNKAEDVVGASGKGGALPHLMEGQGGLGRDIKKQEQNAADAGEATRQQGSGDVFGQDGN